MRQWLFLLLIISAPLFAAPRVVVSIKPIHDVTLAVMEGAGTPTLLVPSGASPHNYALAPSQAKALYQADAIIWIGPGLETFLTQPLNQRKKDSVLMTLLDIPTMTLYPTSGAETHEHGSIDPHLWLDPTNLMQYASALAHTLSKLDPEHATLYQNNAQRTIKHLLTLDQTLNQQLKPSHDHPIMVFHDAYQYFSKRYGLDVVGTVVLRPDVMPSVSRILQIQDTLKSKKVTCIFTEPQFKPAVVERLVANTKIKIGILDPLGSPSPTGLLGIEALFNNLSKSVTGCLKPA
jgi:zinc transport system substrate-binding protein